MMKIKKKHIIIISATILLVGIGCFGIYAMTAGPNPAKQTSDEIFKYVSSEKFQTLERDKQRDYLRTSMQTRMNNNAATYAKLPLAEKPAYLDKVIDEMGTEMQRFSQLRQSGRDPNSTLARREPGPDDQQRAQQWQERRRQMSSPAGQRSRMESVSPEVSDFRKAIRERMRERGIGFGQGRGR